MKTWTKSKPQWTQHQLWETRMRRRLNQCFCSHCLCQVSKKFKKSASLSDFSFRDNYATSPYQQETLWETIVTLRGCDVKPMFVFPVSREIGALGADCDPFPDWGRSPVVTMGNAWTARLKYSFVVVPVFSTDPFLTELLEPQANMLFCILSAV